MSNTKSKAVLGQEPMPVPMGSEVVNVVLSASVLAANLAANDIVQIGYIPADCVLVDAVYVADDLDSNGSPTLSLSFGTLNAAADDLDTTIQSGITIGQAGGALRMTPTKAALAVKGGDSGVEIGFKVATAAATGAAGDVQVSLSYRSVHHGS